MKSDAKICFYVTFTEFKSLWPLYTRIVAVPRDPLGKIKEGDIVLDLGSGGGKVPYIVSQIVGETGTVIGVDMNDDMLALAKKYQQEIIDILGYDNVTFHKGKIQNLKLNLDELNKYIEVNPATSIHDFNAINDHINYLEEKLPMIEDNSIDVVISNCVLNLVSTKEKEQLFIEIYRVLKDGGKAVISDISSNIVVPEEMRNDENLWSGRKGKDGPCIDKGQSVIYKGPFKHIEDDDDHTYQRGERTFVCEKTFNILQQEPYAQLFEFLDENDRQVDSNDECCTPTCNC